jgi:hypothetical protein
LFTTGAIPTIAVSVRNVGALVAKPTVDTDWKSVPVEK